MRYLKRMPHGRKEQVKAAIAEVAGLSDIGSHSNVKAMQAEWMGCYRLRIGRYRALFKITREGAAEFFEVLAVGPRGDVY
ncbi:type II toxin-antitoxin system RelE/ParE family toxin [bacterium]|nr:type II toxin-antitoxin system RelE/ParE family toxin [bacterium]